jgi:predicted metal-dependent hydrolase
MRHKIGFGGREIDFTVEYSQRKTLGIRVHPDEQVQVLAPLQATEEEIKEKVRKKARWILKQIDRFRTYVPATPSRRFVSGETHLYIGRQYRLKIAAGQQNDIKAYRGQLWIITPDTRPAALKKQLDHWYSSRASVIFHELLEEVLPRFRKYKIERPLMTIRKMEKRWGSCTPGGRIILNTELIKAPKSCIEYVIVHELCHLVHHNHARLFQTLLNKMMPDWKKRKDKLEYSLI